MNTTQKEIGKVLIVEDDPTNIFLAEILLKNEFEIHSVTNGHDAIKAVDEKEFDVVLMDINLGDEGMDGIRTMRIIKQKRRHRYLKIFAITAYSDAEQWFLKEGFDEFFMKPVNDKVTNAIRETLIKKSSGDRVSKNRMAVCA